MAVRKGTIKVMHGKPGTTPRIQEEIGDTMKTYSMNEWKEELARREAEDKKAVAKAEAKGKATSKKAPVKATASAEAPSKPVSKLSGSAKKEKPKLKTKAK